MESALLCWLLLMVSVPSVLSQTVRFCCIAPFTPFSGCSAFNTNSTQYSCMENSGFYFNDDCTKCQMVPGTDGSECYACCAATNMCDTDTDVYVLLFFMLPIIASFGICIISAKESMGMGPEMETETRTRTKVPWRQAYFITSIVNPLSSSSPAIQKIYCVKCGEEIQSGASLCGQCGAQSVALRQPLVEASSSPGGPDAATCDDDDDSNLLEAIEVVDEGER